MLFNELYRNAALLPGYFIVNEILKSYPVSNIFLFVNISILNLITCKFILGKQQLAPLVSGATSRQVSGFLQVS
jgi:hypothetical protein